MLIKNSNSQNFIHADDQQWENLKDLRKFFSDLQLPSGYEAVYASIEPGEDNIPQVELLVVQNFPRLLAEEVYQHILSLLGADHPFMKCISQPAAQFNDLNKT